LNKTEEHKYLPENIIRALCSMGSSADPTISIRIPEYHAIWGFSVERYCYLVINGYSVKVYSKRVVN
jgi:hypothetical protein